MNDEIKEILDKLKDDDWYDELDLTGEMWIELRWKETHLLLDYITNLQQENYELNRMCELYGKSLYYAELKDYKSRCEKAYEELTYMSSSDYVKDYDIKQNCWIKLSNILQNGSDSQ